MTAIPVAREAATSFAVANPYSRKILAELGESSTAEIAATVARARKAAAAFRHSTPFERRDLLNRLAALVERDAEALARTISDEMGKTISEARNEIRRAQNTLRLSGDAATFLDGEVMHCAIVSGGVDRQAVVTFQPVGVVAAITPFNYPVNLLCHKLGPAIAAGNAVVVKPSPKAPLAATMLVALTREAGFSDDLVQAVQGGARPAIDLARSAIDLLSFTGGPAAGLALKQASGLVRCLMELGGNDPLIVLPDADLVAAADTAVAHRCEIAGQSCAAVKKLYLHEDVAERFTGMVADRLSVLRVGDPSQDATQMGTVIDEAAAAMIAARLAEARGAGASIVTGGAHRGTLFQPTLVADVPPSCQLFATETFGPVISTRRFRDLNGVIAEINATQFGLQAGIFTNDHAAIRKVSRELQVGGVMINEGPDFRAEHVPFGGIKSSGMGREGVRITMREMSETRVVID